MNSYLYMVTYDLNVPGKNYQDLYRALEGYDYWHCVDSTWIIKTNSTAIQIRDSLKPYLDSNDKLLVVRLTGESAWTGFRDDCSNWLRVSFNEQPLIN